MPSSGVIFAVLSLAYCLVFLDKGFNGQYSVFSCAFVILSLIVLYVYFSVNVEDAISQEGGVCYRF